MKRSRKPARIVAKSAAEARGIRKALRAIGSKFKFASIRKRPRRAVRRGRRVPNAGIFVKCPSCGDYVKPIQKTRGSIVSRTCPRCGYELSSRRKKRK